MQLLGLLGCPDAARLARQELQEIAQEALKTGPARHSAKAYLHVAKWSLLQDGSSRTFEPNANSCRPAWGFLFSPRPNNVFTLGVLTVMVTVC